MFPGFPNQSPLLNMVQITKMMQQEGMEMNKMNRTVWHGNKRDERE